MSTEINIIIILIASLFCVAIALVLIVLKIQRKRKNNKSKIQQQKLQMTQITLIESGNNTIQVNNSEGNDKKNKLTALESAPKSTESELNEVEGDNKKTKSGNKGVINEHSISDSDDMYTIQPRKITSKSDVTSKGSIISDVGDV